MERVLITEHLSPPPAHKIIPLKLLLLIKASPAFMEFVGWLVGALLHLTRVLCKSMGKELFT